MLLSLAGKILLELDASINNNSLWNVQRPRQQQQQQYHQLSTLLDHTLRVKQLMVAVHKSYYTEQPYSKDKSEEVEDKDKDKRTGTRGW